MFNQRFRSRKKWIFNIPRENIQSCQSMPVGAHFALDPACNSAADSHNNCSVCDKSMKFGTLIARYIPNRIRDGGIQDFQHGARGSHVPKWPPAVTDFLRVSDLMRYFRHVYHNILYSNTIIVFLQKNRWIFSISTSGVHNDQFVTLAARSPKSTLLICIGLHHYVQSDRA